MQNAKDSFYEVLRSRLASLDPDRTVVVRGVTRPAVVVDENETQSLAGVPDCFHLRWSEGVHVADGEMPLVTLRCEIRYETAGNAWSGGLDRGRVLASMDAELLALLSNVPQNAPKWNYEPLQSGGAPVAMTTRIWWSDPTFGVAKVKADRLCRAVAVDVMAFEEKGEL